MIDPLRVLLFALVVAAAAASLPAQSQTLHFGLGIGANDGDDDGFRGGRLCILTDSGLRNAIEDEGYDDVFLNVPIGRYAQARATRGDWVYLLRVNACTGDIVARERLRPAG